MKLVIMASGRGSHFISLTQLVLTEPQIQISGLLSDKPNAPVVAYAIEQAIPVCAKDGKALGSVALESDFLTALHDFSPDCILLAGYMRILSADFIERCGCPVLNVHPSLLPKYKGLNTHARAIEARDTEHGVSVHLVTPTLDDGPLIAQSVCEIIASDTPDTLAARLLPLEHALYTQVVSWLAEGRLSWDYQGNAFTFDGKPLPTGGLPV